MPMACGKHGGIARARNAMQRLVPGLVVGNAEARNRGGPVFKLVGLLIERHAAYEVVGPFLRRKVRIEIGGLLRHGEESNGSQEK